MAFEGLPDAISNRVKTDLNTMAIRKDRHLSPLEDKTQKKKEEKKEKQGKHNPDLSYEGGVDSQQDQLNDVPKATEKKQNISDEDKKE